MLDKSIRDSVVFFAAVFGMSRNARHPKKRLRRRLEIPRPCGKIISNSETEKVPYCY